MDGLRQTRERGWTRAGLFRRAAAGGAAVAGGAAIGARGDDGASLAAPSAGTDAKILNFFLLLEYLQEAFYREALRTGTARQATLNEYARSVGGQESEHVAFLTQTAGQPCPGAAAAGLRGRAERSRALPRRRDRARGDCDRRLHRPRREPHAEHRRGRRNPALRRGPAGGVAARPRRRVACAARRRSARGSRTTYSRELRKRGFLA